MSYQPGTLEAVAYENGAALSRHSLSTVRADSAGVRVDVEPAEGLPVREMIYADISLTDKDGTCLPAKAGLTAAVTGDGVLEELGSGDPKPLTGYTGGVSALFHGRALAIIRTTREHGRVTLSVTAEGYATAVKAIEY